MKIKTITDEEILDLILSGRLFALNLDHPNPIICKDGRSLTASLVNSGRCSNLPRYRVEICLPKKSKRHRKPRKRTIVRSKLIWMIVNKRVLPIGHQVHHVDEDRLNDAGKNLVDLSDYDHNQYHNGDPF